MKNLLVILTCVASALAQAKPADASASSAIHSGSSTQAVPDKGKVLIDQMIQALGGDAYLNIQDVSQQGRTYSFFHGQPTSTGVPFWRFTKFPDKERIEVTKHRDVVNVYIGDKG